MIFSERETVAKIYFLVPVVHELDLLCLLIDIDEPLTNDD